MYDPLLSRTPSQHPVHDQFDLVGCFCPIVAGCKGAHIIVQERKNVDPPDVYLFITSRDVIYIHLWSNTTCTRYKFLIHLFYMYFNLIYLLILDIFIFV
jgi:hypothetical protein